MHLYCSQQGIIKSLTETEQKDLYKLQCLIKAESALDSAKSSLLYAEQLIKMSHDYD